MGSRLEKNSNAVQKAIENHKFNDEGGEEYEPSKFGGFPDYFRRKKIKLQNLDVDIRAQAGDKPQIFKGIVVHVNGYTQPSLNDIHVMVVSHGGGFMQYLDGKTQVTHIIASNLTPKKIEEFKRYRIVKPAWIVDSVDAGKLQPWHSYRLVDEGASQKVLNFDNGNVTSQVNDVQRGYKYQSDTSWYTKQLNAATQDAPVATISASNQPNSAKGELSTATAIVHDQRLQEAIDDASGDGQPIQPVAHNNEAILSFQQEDNLYDADLVEAAFPEVPEEKDGGDNKEANSKIADNEESRKRRSSPSNEPISAKKTKLTAEEHNTILLSDPRIRKSSVLNPEFLEQYYRESRLHHLSFWRADWKSKIQAMTAAKSSSQRARQKRPPGARRYILHVDFDSFFVSVSLKNFPDYVDKPACVAHGTGNNSEVASCNYPARKFGLKNGMWMKNAHEMCKDIKVLPYDFPAYEAASKIFYDAVLDTDGIVQSISVDEALVDVTMACLAAGGTDGTNNEDEATRLEQEKAEEIAQNIRTRVRKESGCEVSVGIGSNILLAKTALRKAKPAGQYQVKPNNVLDFLAELPVRDLPGVAYSIGGKLEDEGIKLIKDIRNTSKERLTTLLGPKTGEKLWNYSKGIDKTEVGDPAERKSVSAEVNWGVRFETSAQAEEFVESLCRELNSRLVREGVKGKQLTMKVMKRSADAPLDPPKHLGHGKCDTFNKSVALGVATNDPNVLAKEALAILRHYAFQPGELRGLGVQMTKLEPLKGSSAKATDSGQKRLLFKPQESDNSPNQSILPKQDSATGTTYGPAQKRLQFKTAPANNTTAESKDPIQDDIATPKSKRISEFMQGMPESNSPSRKPLNTSGTQFVFPSQIDPSVVAELPEDIRTKLEEHLQRHDSEEVMSESHSKIRDSDHQTSFDPSAVLPSESQLDTETLNQLPADVRAEIMAHYSSKTSGQSLLPQSPRKDRTLPNTRKPISSRGRPRGSSSSVLSRLKGAGTSRSSTLTQTNFISCNLPHAQEAATGGLDEHTNTMEISEDFLAALPEDLRREVVEQHRADQLKRNAGLAVFNRRSAKSTKLGRNADSKGQKLNGADGVGNILEGELNSRLFILPNRPEKPGFTTQKLSQIQDLREAVSLWVEEFREEGPYKEDVEALGKYLKSVVCEEQDMNKAVGLVKWMSWVIVGSSDSNESLATSKWIEALERTKDRVQEAVRSRGLGVIEF